MDTYLHIALSELYFQYAIKTFADIAAVDAYMEEE